MAIEDQVRDFYDSTGWQSGTAGSDAVYGDAQLWEDLRPCAAAYVSACRLKLLEFLPQSGTRILDAGSGPIQYPEYLEYSRGFAQRVCVDLSQRALDEAREKLGDRGDYVRASLLELPFPDDHFDAAVSLHTIYHIERDRQEAAVWELVRVLKPGARAVVVYANPGPAGGACEAARSARKTSRRRTDLLLRAPTFVVEAILRRGRGRDHAVAIAQRQ